jgi:hypothetical protein
MLLHALALSLHNKLYVPLEPQVVSVLHKGVRSCVSEYRRKNSFAPG